MNITQADREAAALIYQSKRDRDMASWIKGGKVDTDWIVQAFAAHRLRGANATWNHRPIAGGVLSE